MTTELRPITEDDWHAYCEIRSQAYHMPLKRLLEYSATVDFTETRCLFVNGKMQATGRLFSFEQYLHGRLVPMGGIASIAVRLEQRGQGHIRQILTQMFLEMRERRIPVSTLYPSVYALYRRFGFEIAAEHRIVTVTNRRENLFTSERAAGTLRLASTPEDFATLFDLYDRWASGQHGTVRRRPDYWNARILFTSYEEDRRTAYLWFDANGEPQGYLLLNAPENRRLDIQELIALTGEAQLALLALLQQDNILDEWSWYVETDTTLPTLLADPKSVTTKITPSFMARIIDVTTAWPILTSTAVDGRLHLGVRDEVCPWNEGTWELTVEDGDGRVVRSGEAAQALADIGTWSQLLYGFLTVDEAVFLGKLSVSDPSVLPRLRTLWKTDSPPVMLDAF